MAINLLASPVSSLLKPRSPAAIFRRVITVVIDAFQRQFLRLFTHVCEKVREAVSPSFADRDAAPAPVVKLLGIRVVATCEHTLPTAIGRRYPSAAAGRTVSGYGTATTCALAIKQIVTAHLAFGSADTAAPPFLMRRLLARLAYPENGPAAKNLIKRGFIMHYRGAPS